MWFYENDQNNKIRYILGEDGDNPLFCIGINPSTAEPNNLDHTVKKVKSLSLIYEYDGWIMLNVYPQRSTDPSSIDGCCNLEIHNNNLKFIRKFFSLYKKPNVWAAWGILIDKRLFFINCLNDIFELGKKLNVNWITFGELTKKGHPRHPLYLSKNSKKYNFNMENYINNLF
jgi:hypothetical protein